MSKTKNSETAVYAAVISGDLEVWGDGTIWRVAVRTGDRWNPGAYRHCPVPRRRAEHRLPSGYLQVRLMLKGKRANALAHRLVYRHFHGPIAPGMTVNHKNGLKDDNRPENLELATDSQQMLHAFHVLNRLDQKGERNNHVKLSDAQVAEIRQRRYARETLSLIAKDYGVTFQTISRIALHQRR